jgi:hypothetical protein
MFLRYTLTESESGSAVPRALAFAAPDSAR